MEPFKEKKTILDAETVKDTLSSSIVKPLTVQKKPVKFTWDGLLNFGVSLSNTPIGKYNIQSLIDNTLPRATDIVKGRKKPQEKDYIDFFEDMEKSIFGAAQNIGYSIGDIITTGVDMGAAVAGKETNLTEKLTEVYGADNKVNGLPGFRESQSLAAQIILVNSFIQKQTNKKYFKKDITIYTKWIESVNNLKEMGFSDKEIFEKKINAGN